MTGFGRGQGNSGGFAFSVEITSVNRKQLDTANNLPRDLAELEPQLKKLVAEHASRGRFNLSLHWKPENDQKGTKSLLIDQDLAAQYLKLHKETSRLLDIPDTVTTKDILHADSVLKVEEDTLVPEEAWPGIREAMVSALEALIEMRSVEGKHLFDDLTSRVSTLRKITSSITTLAPEITEHHKSNLHARINEAGIDTPIDDDRLAKEIAVFAERSDISEELSRLDSHFAQLTSYLEASTPSGRELDFLAQELFREFNTIASKANSAPIAQLVVSAKAEVEKIREQVQNVE